MNAANKAWITRRANAAQKAQEELDRATIRSAAAHKAVATRRKHAETAQHAARQQMLSERALKAWETRRANESI